MTRMSGLVPASHRPFEHALAQALAPIGSIDPAAINDLWSPWRCPAPLLPFLAWAVSVDLWDDDWDENTKRATIAASHDYHRRKGTDAAVDAAIAALGRPASSVNWYETVPEGRRGTFEIHIPLTDNDTADTMAQAVVAARRLVGMAKPKSRAFAVVLTREVTGTLGVSTGINSVETVALVAPPDIMDTALTMTAGIAAAETVTLGV